MWVGLVVGSLGGWVEGDVGRGCLGLKENCWGWKELFFGVCGGGEVGVCWCGIVEKEDWVGIGEFDGCFFWRG